MEHFSLLSIAVVLFLIIDPIGTIGAYLALMRDVPPNRKLLVLLRELGFALIAMLAFNYLGEYIFDLLEISPTTVRLASGTILFLIAIRILFPGKHGLRTDLPPGEPFLVPLAIPFIAGPALLATIMLYAHMEASEPIMLAAILLSTFAAGVVFYIAPFLYRYLGNNGLVALEKLMGMVLILLAIQRFADGLQEFFALHVN